MQIKQDLKQGDKVWWKPTCYSFEQTTNNCLFSKDKLYLTELLVLPDFYETTDETNRYALIKSKGYCAYLRGSGNWILPTFNELIQKQKDLGSFFTVWFIKKDGTERKMTCRFGVKKHLKGGKVTLDEERFWIVWSCGDKDYRAVNKETVFRVKCQGVEYEL